MRRYPRTTLTAIAGLRLTWWQTWLCVGRRPRRGPSRRRSPSARSCGVQGECERGAARPGVRAATGSARWPPPRPRRRLSRRATIRKAPCAVRWALPNTSG